MIIKNTIILYTNVPNLFGKTCKATTTKNKQANKTKQYFGYIVAVSLLVE
jgi:hypothetical protein